MSLSPHLPATTGIGLRSVHYRALAESLPDIGWLEAHSENYFGAGGAPLRWLSQLRAHYPLSLHGVGLSLGSSDELSQKHLAKLKQLVDRFQPALVSEHICWSSINQRFLNELLPLPYTEEALAHLVQRVDYVQSYLGRQILLENVSSYLSFAASTIPEWEFVAELSRRSGCGILLDINNIYVNAINHGFDAETYLNAIPREAVQEFHLAGFDDSHGDILIDTHSRPVAEPVWHLYAKALQRFGAVPTLLEWDADIPELPELIAEARKADSIREQLNVLAA